MRPLSLKTGLLLALFPLAMAFAAGEQQDDKSYLPPASLRSAPEATAAPASRQTAMEPGRHARVVHRRHYRRYAGPAYYFWPF